MSEEDKKEKTLPNMKVLAQFIRDLSFENILAQKGLDSNSPPNISVNVNLDAKKRKHLRKKKLSGKYSSFTIAGSAVGVTANRFKGWNKIFS